MRQRFALAAVIAVVGLLTFSRAASACSCAYPGPACQAFWNADAVFEATVVQIALIPRTETIGAREYEFADKLVTLQVHRSWKGPQPGPLEVTTARYGAACGFDFKEGNRYLVFAHNDRTSGRFAVSSCSRTQQTDGIDPSAELLAFLGAPERGGRVFGTVRTAYRVFRTGRAYDERKTETTVRLFTGGQERTTKSSGGEYEFSGLPEGAYRIEIETPAGYTTHSTAQDVPLPNRRACAEVNFRFSPDGRIAGRLIGRDGTPLPNVSVEVTSTEARPHPDYGLQKDSTRTEADGLFELKNLPPGRYIVGVNLNDLPSKSNPYARVVYPGPSAEPQVIDLEVGEVVDLGTWHMPDPLPVVRIEGIVLRRDGTPVEGIHVGAWDETGNPVERARGAGSATSGADGRFVLELRQGRLYRLSARGPKNRSLGIDAPRLDTSQALDGPIRIIVE